MMLIEEFVDHRVRAGEVLREEREREQARRRDEHRQWLRAVPRRSRSGTTDAPAGRPFAPAPVDSALVDRALDDRVPA